MQRLVSTPAKVTYNSSLGERRLAPCTPVALLQRVHGAQQRLRKHTQVHAQEPSGTAASSDCLGHDIVMVLCALLGDM